MTEIATVILKMVRMKRGGACMKLSLREQFILFPLILIMSNCIQAPVVKPVQPQIPGPNPVIFTVSGRFDFIFNSTIQAIESLKYKIEKQDRGQSGGIIIAGMNDVIPAYAPRSEMGVAGLLGPQVETVRKVQVVIDPDGNETVLLYRITITGMHLKDFYIGKIEYRIKEAKKYQPPDLVAKSVADAIKEQINKTRSK